ncbi:MAG: hypothetical protein M3N48_03360 [Verrucomicrobiota bacterium]|nr:hypothetical protein [Verrucomicrobiota bacterium]
MKTLKPLASVFALILSIFAATGTAFAASPFKKISGGLLHVSSGVIFPSRVGAFRFEGTKFYGSAGRDVGAEYDVEPLIRGDVYVYPLGTYGKDFNAETRVQQNAINKLYKAVKQVSQSRFQLNQTGRNITGVRAQYELTRAIFRSNARRCGSQFYLFRDGPWLVAYRFSYPIEQTAAANKQIVDFLRGWQWRVRGTVTQLEQRSADGRRS